MKRAKFTSNLSMNDVCKRIEEMIPCVLGTAHNKTKLDKDIVYYPARRFMCTDDNMDDVTIVVRKVNNTTTSVKLEYSEYTKNNTIPSFFGIKAADDGWKITVLEKAYSTLENVLGQMFNK